MWLGFLLRNIPDLSESFALDCRVADMTGHVYQNRQPSPSIALRLAAVILSLTTSVAFRPDSGVSSIRRARKLSADKLQPVGMAHDG